MGLMALYWHLLAMASAVAAGVAVECGVYGHATAFLGIAVVAAARSTAAEIKGGA